MDTKYNLNPETIVSGFFYIKEKKCQNAFIAASYFQKQYNMPSLRGPGLHRPPCGV